MMCCCLRCVVFCMWLLCGCDKKIHQHSTQWILYFIFLPQQVRRMMACWHHTFKYDIRHTQNREAQLESESWIADFSSKWNRMKCMGLDCECAICYAKVPPPIEFIRLSCVRVAISSYSLVHLCVCLCEHNCTHTLSSIILNTHSGVRIFYEPPMLCVLHTHAQTKHRRRISDFEA